RGCGDGGKKWIRCDALCLWIIFHKARDRGIRQHPQIPCLVLIDALAGQSIRDRWGTSNLSCLRVHMKETAFADKPDFFMPTDDNLSDPANKLAVAVVAIMNKSSAPRIKPVEATVYTAKPKVAPTVPGDARHVCTADAIRIVHVMEVACAALRCGVESVHSSVGRDPQISVVIFDQVLKKVGA